jgi:hypothetical protein
MRGSRLIDLREKGREREEKEKRKTFTHRDAWGTEFAEKRATVLNGRLCYKSGSRAPALHKGGG